MMGKFDIAEAPPSFPGGMDSLTAYIQRNLVYPAKGIEAGIEGKVIIGFVVAENGEVQRARVVKGIAPEFDEAALPVVSEMPNWIPGKQNGVPRMVSFQLPIRFVLPKNQGQ